MNTIEKLKKKENFTGVEIALADYILNNIDDVQNMSLQDLAGAAYVSKPSAIRLYRKLGFKNYREFSVALQVEKIRYEDDFILDKTEKLDEVKSNIDIAEYLSIVSKKIVDHCRNSIDPDTLDEIIESIANARRIFIYPIGNCMPAAKSFTNRLTSINLFPILMSTDENRQGVIHTMTDEDVILVLMQDDVTSEQDFEFLRAVRKAGTRMILMTTSDYSIYHKESDLLVYTYPESDDLIRSDAFTIQIAFLYGLNILFGCLKKYQEEHTEKQGA